MKETKTLKEMNMGELWALAKSRGISVKGKKKSELIAELVIEDSEKVEKKETVEKEKPVLVKATLEDGTEILIPAKDVTSVEPAKKGELVTIKSVDGRELEVSIGDQYWKGKVIEVPSELAQDVKRILRDGGFYIL
jgi:hypothetical protein